jgi:hypothetical protein
MTRPRIPTGLYAIGWLFLLHGLANIFVGVFRVLDMHRASTDVLAGALPRAQVCLLVIWLMLGKERLSWRLCGLIAGCCFIFMVYSQLLFPGEYGLGHAAEWLAAEWLYYFRISGPGDWLVRLPILAVGVAVPLLIWRLCLAIRAVRQAGLKWTQIFSRSRFQFRFQDMAIWTVTICLALAAVYRTAAYAGWFRELLGRWQQVYHFDIAEDVKAEYVVAIAFMHAFVALVSLWAVTSKTRWWLRLPVTVVLVVGPAYACELLLKRANYGVDWSSGQSAVWGQASAETLTTVVMAATIVVSLLLFQLYETLSRAASLSLPKG